MEARGQDRALALAFSSEVATLRVAAGMTQKQLAAKLGIVRANMARMEKGKHVPSLGQFIRLAEVFGHDPAEVFRRVVERARSAEARAPQEAS